MSTTKNIVNNYLSPTTEQTIIDPIAQTFTIDRKCFLTSAQLFFAEKDSNNNETVTIDIRKVLNGVPTNEVYVNSEKTLDMGNVVVSSTASSETNFIFEVPVSLDSGEYALTVFTRSSKVKLWVSESGLPDITGQPVLKEQGVGVLFRSQNSSTWAPDLLLDLKFRLYKAYFDKNMISSLLLSTGPYTSRRNELDLDPIELYPGKSFAKIYHKNHGLKNGSYTFLSPFSTQFKRDLFESGYDGNIFGVPEKNYVGVHTISNVTNDSYTISLPNVVDSNVKVVTRFGNELTAHTNTTYHEVFPSIAVDKNLDGLVSHFILTTDTSYNRNSNYNFINNKKEYKFDSTKIIASDENRARFMSSLEGMIYGIEILTNDNYTAPYIDLEKSSITLIQNDINNPTYDTEHIIPTDEINIASGNTIGFTKISSTTGTIDLSNTYSQLTRSNAISIPSGSIIKIKGCNNTGNVRVINVLNNGANILVYGNVQNETANFLSSSNVTILNGPHFIAEEAASGGSARSKYITRPLNFVNPNTSFKIYLDINKPIDTYVKFYYRTSYTGETSSIYDKEYVLISNITIADSLTEAFTELEQLVDGIESFDGLQLKIVFLSDNPAKIPKCKNLRIIALA